jgi:hypothetical protein
MSTLQENDIIDVFLTPEGEQTFRLMPAGTDCSVDLTTLSQAISLARSGDLLAASALLPGYHIESLGCAFNDELFLLTSDADYTEVEAGTGSGFDYSYQPAIAAGQDFLGTPIQTSAAPRLTAIAQIKPRPKGNWYPLPEQTALNVAKPDRIPPFVARGMISYAGGFYSEEINNQFDERFTHFAESAQWPGGTYPTTRKRMIEQAFYQQAWECANALADPNFIQNVPDRDTVRQQLYDWSSRQASGPDNGYEGNHILITSEEACKWYALYIYLLFNTPDWKGAGVDAFSINQEVNTRREEGGLTAYQQWYQQGAWLVKWILSWAATGGNNTMISVLTDHGNLTHPNPEYYADPVNGDPNLPGYMHYSTMPEYIRGTSQSDPIGNTTLLSQQVRSGKATIGSNTYCRATRSASMFEKNSDGTFKIVNGEPVLRTDKRTVTINGQTCILTRFDGYRALVGHYNMLARYLANDFFLAGCVHLADYNTRKSGYEAIQLSGAYRLDTEVPPEVDQLGLSPDEVDSLNNRPLYGPWAESWAFWLYMHNPIIRGFMENQPMTVLGADNGKKSKARASVETTLKGFQRAANFNWLFTVPHKIGYAKLPIFKNYTDFTSERYEQFWRKPAMQVRIATKDGLPTLWFAGEMPWQDEGVMTDGVLWGDNGAGVVTPGYKVTFDGPILTADYFSLPSAATGLLPKHIYLQLTDMTGELLTFRFDYREARITNHPTPPSLA